MLSDPLQEITPFSRIFFSKVENFSPDSMKTSSNSSTAPLLPRFISSLAFFASSQRMERRSLRLPDCSSSLGAGTKLFHLDLFQFVPRSIERLSNFCLILSHGSGDHFFSIRFFRVSRSIERLNFRIYSHTHLRN